MKPQPSEGKHRVGFPRFNVEMTKLEMATRDIHMTNNIATASAFEAVVLEVLNRDDAFACVSRETLRRLEDAMSAANMAVVIEPK